MTDQVSFEQTQTKPEAATVEVGSYLPSQEQLQQIQALLDILKQCDEQGIKISVAGGYGLDGFYGSLTRDHHDADLLVRDAQEADLISLLESNGYVRNKVTDQDVVGFSKPESEHFKIEFASTAKLTQLTDLDSSHFLPDEPNATLLGQPFTVPDLPAQREIIRIQEVRAKANNWTPYPSEKIANRDAIFREIGKMGLF